MNYRTQCSFCPNLLVNLLMKIKKYIADNITVLPNSKCILSCKKDLILKFNVNMLAR